MHVHRQAAGIGHQHGRPNVRNYFDGRCGARKHTAAFEQAVDVERRAEVVFRGVCQVFGQFIRNVPEQVFSQPKLVVRHDTDHGHVVAEAETVSMGQFAEIAAANGVRLAVVPDAIGTGVDDAPGASLVNQVG